VPSIPFRAWDPRSSPSCWPLQPGPGPLVSRSHHPSSKVPGAAADVTVAQLDLASVQPPDLQPNPALLLSEWEGWGQVSKLQAAKAS
jgi:hypothetical protein